MNFPEKRHEDKDKDNDDKKPGGGNAAGGTPGGEVWSWESASVLSLLSEGGDFIVPALHLVSSFDAPFEVLFVSFSNLKIFSTTTLRCQYEKIQASVSASVLCNTSSDVRRPKGEAFEPAPQSVWPGKLAPWSSSVWVNPHSTKCLHSVTGVVSVKWLTLTWLLPKKIHKNNPLFFSLL